MKRPFSVLLIDDSCRQQVEEGTPNTAATLLSGSRTKLHTHTDVLLPLLQFADDDGRSSAELEVFVSFSVGLEEVYRIWPRGDTKEVYRHDPTFAALAPLERERKESERAFEFLNRVDIIILDLGGVGVPRWGLREQAREAMGDDYAELRSKYSGAEFYLALRDRLPHCQAVFIQTQYAHPSKLPDVLARHLLPWCTGRDDQRPYTVMYATGEENFKHVGQEIGAMYQDFRADFWQLEQRVAIERAASHDLPILIVGETGTGKEYLARAIHRRWAQRKGQEALLSRFEVMNCGGISSSLAQSELFGVVKGSYTDAKDHRIGRLLKACGVSAGHLKRKKKTIEPKFQKMLDELEALRRDFATLNTAPPPPADEAVKIERGILSRIAFLMDQQGFREYGTDLFCLIRAINRKMERALDETGLETQFRSILVTHNPGLCEPVVGSDWDLQIKSSGPCGTLFLDELGDIPIDIQSLLIRYLENGEVQPLGYPGLITGANVRLIAATSDPRVARFAGERLVGTFRSHVELEQRPLREDLLHRLKGDVVRASPVTAENAQRVVEGFVQREEGPVWEPSAITAFARFVELQIKKVEESEEKGGEDRLSFGHRREIRRCIRLTNVVTETAGRRGVWGVPKTVTEAYLKIIWPSIWKESWIGPGNAGDAGAQRVKWTPSLCREKGLFKGPETKEYKLLVYVFERMESNRGLIDANVAAVDLQDQQVRGTFDRLKAALSEWGERDGCDLTFSKESTRSQFELVRL